MIKLLGAIWRFSADESGTEVSELAIVLALLVVASVSIIKLIGPKVVQMYSDTNDPLP